MSLQDSENRTSGRAGWFAMGALTASLAFVILIVAGDVLAIGKEKQVEAEVPALIIEAE